MCNDLQLLLSPKIIPLWPCEHCLLWPFCCFPTESHFIADICGQGRTILFFLSIPFPNYIHIQLYICIQRFEYILYIYTELQIFAEIYKFNLNLFCFNHEHCRRISSPVGADQNTQTLSFISVRNPSEIYSSFLFDVTSSGSKWL